jgi:hypothetical protein
MGSGDRVHENFGSGTLNGASAPGGACSVACYSSSISLDTRNLPGVPLTAGCCDWGGGAPSGVSSKEYQPKFPLSFVFPSFPIASRPLDGRDDSGLSFCELMVQGWADVRRARCFVRCRTRSASLTMSKMTLIIESIMMPARVPLLRAWLGLVSVREAESPVVTIRQARKAVFKPAGKGVSARVGGAVSLSLGWFENQDAVSL